ncbi:MAG: DsbA family protein [Solirubrobacteraceae bacterium]
MAGVHAYFYTDPACPWSWSLQPALRRLDVEFDGAIELRPVMGGLAREFADPLAQVRQWLEAGATSGMPVDPRLWIESPPTSSYPACLAVEAAGEQGPDLQAAYLRAAREGLACGRRRLDSADALVDLARAVAGLDVERFRIDLESNAIVELLGADFERADEAGRRGGDEGRVRLPSLEFTGDDGEVHGVYGHQPYDAYRRAAQAAGAGPAAGPAPSVEDALRRFGTMATPEVASACDLPGPRAAAELWRLAADWRVRFEPGLTGELWSLA